MSQENTRPDFQLMDVYEELKKQKGIKAVIDERIEWYLTYLELFDDLQTAIDNSKPQNEINTLRKKLNNARVRITPWLKKEIACL